MEFIPSSLVYPDSEKIKLSELSELFEKWYQTFEQSHFPKDYKATHMVFDGFYPYYFSQKKKILFIGREALGISGTNNLSILYEAYQNNRIGKKTLNQNLFHRRMYYLAYGIMNDFPDWNTIPYALDMVEKFATSDGLSFSFMNISKFSNDADDWAADWQLIKSSVNASITDEVNYIEEEIKLLDPDIVITMNFKDKGLMDFVGETSFIKEWPGAYELQFKMKDREVPLIDLFHFSSPGKSDKEHYYDNVRNILCRS